MTQQSSPEISVSRPARIIALAVTVTTCVTATAAALVYATDIFLILFLAILFAVFLTHSSAWLSRKMGLPYLWCLAGVVSTLLVSAGASVVLFGAQIDQQLSGLDKRLDQAQDKLQDLSDQYPSLKSILSTTPFIRDALKKSDTRSSESSAPKEDATDDAKGNPEDHSQQPTSARQQALSRVAGTAATAVSNIFQTAFGLVVNSVLIFFVVLFLATNPQSYRDGVVTLFPVKSRERSREVLDMMGDSLWKWLVGRFGSMLITGAGAGLLLMLLEVPMAITVGLATGLMTFVPNIGSVISLTLAMLLALPEGVVTVQLVFAGYVGLQIIESYVITPLIQQKQVSLPPALLISCQAVMGVLFGFLGAAVASPFLAAAKTGIEEAYVKDVLGDSE